MLLPVCGGSSPGGPGLPLKVALSWGQAWPPLQICRLRPPARNLKMLCLPRARKWRVALGLCLLRGRGELGSYQATVLWVRVAVSAPKPVCGPVLHRPPQCDTLCVWNTFRSLGTGWGQGRASPGTGHLSGLQGRTEGTGTPHVPRPGGCRGRVGGGRQGDSRENMTGPQRPSPRGSSH